jgi:sulfite exporter TauE/SafE
MTGTLLLTATLMGAAATPHCAAMCAGACRLITRSAATGPASTRWWAWLGGRLLGYAGAGAAAASLGASLRWLSDTQPWARPLWLMLQLAMLALGLALLWRGRLPLVIEVWLERSRRPTGIQAGEQVVRWKSGLQAAGTGVLWVALPCGVLQAALVIAALASDAFEGAAAMSLFALASTPGLLLGQLVWRKVWPAPTESAARNGPALPAPYGIAASWSLRLAGAGIAVMSGGTVLMSVWAPLQAAWCA